MAAPGLPAGPPFPGGGGAARDTAFTYAEWKNGTAGNGDNRLYQQNAVGPWQLPNKDCVPVWPARGTVIAGTRRRNDLNYHERPSLLQMEANWPLPLVGGAAQPHATRFHLRQTKAIDQITDALVIHTNAARLLNYGSQFPNEWRNLANDRAAVANNASTFIAADAALPRLTARSMPAFANATADRHILVNCPINALVGVVIPGVVYPPGIAAGGAGAAARADYHLRRCYYVALQEGMLPTPLAGAALAAAAGAAGVAPGLYPPFAPANDITFPLIGWLRGYTLQNAANQACIALHEWFHPTPGSESTPAGLAAGGLVALINARRFRYDNVFLTIPNGNNTANPEVLPAGTTPENIFGKEMRAQEFAWHQAFFQILRCPTCDRGPL